GLLPVTHTPPARHPRPAPEFLREHLPGDTAAEHKQNAGETRAIRDARPSTFRPTRWNWQERLDEIPQRIWKQGDKHTRSRYLAEENQVSEVLLQLFRTDGRLKLSRSVSTRPPREHDNPRSRPAAMRRITTRLFARGPRPTEHRLRSAS